MKFLLYHKQRVTTAPTHRVALLQTFEFTLVVWSVLCFSILFGGSGLSFMEESLFKYFVSQSIGTSSVKVPIIPDATLKYVTEKVRCDINYM